MDYFDHFGFSLWNELLYKDRFWFESFELPEDFILDKEGWFRLFSKLGAILKKSGLIENYGGCYHISSKIAKFLKQSNFGQQLSSAKKKFTLETNIPIEIGMHCTFKDVFPPHHENFHETLRQDLEYCDLLDISVLAQHPPDTQNDCIKKLVDNLTSDNIINALTGTKQVLALAWENTDCLNFYRFIGFFGSLKNLVDFRFELVDRLKEMGLKDLINRHLFCFDTGHLLIWRDQHPMGLTTAEQEIDEYLPIFAKNIKAFHIHVNDGNLDSHLIPHSLEFFDHPSRNGIKQEKILKNSEDIMHWLDICNENRGKHIDGIHWHLENLTVPFSMDKITEFGLKLKEILGLN